MNRREMKKVHPNVPALETPRPAAGGGGGRLLDPAVLTVWRKSLLFNGNGFTVYDAKGNLVFRVDNYSSGSKDEILLMDAAGKPLLTIRRKKLSLSDHWLVYEGEEAVNPRFSVRKYVSLLQSKSLARVTPCGGGGGPACSSSSSSAAYEIEGSYAQRCCAVYGAGRRKVAEIRRKEAAVGGVSIGADVFRLVVQPELEAPVAMALVILLEQMFRSR